MSRLVNRCRCNRTLSSPGGVTVSLYGSNSNGRRRFQNVSDGSQFRHVILGIAHTCQSWLSKSNVNIAFGDRMRLDYGDSGWLVPAC